MKAVEDGSIFGKINRLNEALRDVNPKYKPIGFSITSVQSCSPSILKDAISATETAVSTLMSIIGECWQWSFYLDEQSLGGARKVITNR